MKEQLQSLRDEAEKMSLSSAASGDRDSADAWERIGIRLNDLLKITAFDWRVIEERTGLMNRK